VRVPMLVAIVVRVPGVRMRMIVGEPVIRLTSGVAVLAHDASLIGSGWPSRRCSMWKTAWSSRSAT
jgi:hypothetical protein